MNADNSNNNNNNAENSAGAKSQKIEDRVHTLQASLRQGRDRARRDYELATERLGLLQAEVQSAEGAVQERETRHDAIVRETRRLQDEIPPLRATVEKLTKEVRTATRGVRRPSRRRDSVTTHRAIIPLLLTDSQIKLCTFFILALPIDR